MRNALSFLTFVALTTGAAPLAAQTNEPDGSPSSASVPRGPGGGAIIKPADKPADTQKPGEPTMPRPLTYVAPEYPAEAQQKGLEATVILTLDIDKQGHVTKAAVAEGAGHGFDEAAIEASKKLEFEPARKPDGTPFAARIRYRYSFTLKTADSAQGSAPATPQDKAHASFSGIILASGGDVAIAGGSVTIAQKAEGEPPFSASANTDEKGAFTFPDLLPGRYSVTIAAPGYEPLTVEETLSAGEKTEVKYRLLPKGSGLEVFVRGDRPPREVTKRTLEQREISRIPGTNGDAIRSVQNLPGVARPPGMAGLLVIRGSAPQDTETFVDGTSVPLIYHFGGLSSVIPTEVLEKIDFYPGNFSTQYGRLQGGIIDVGMRGPKSEYHGLAQIDLYDGRLLLEGPIPFLKGWTFLAAGRKSWLEAWLGPILKGLGAGVTEAPAYYDYQFMAATNPTPESSLRLAFFGSDDALKLVMDRPSASQPTLAGNVGLHTGFQRIQARYTNDFANGDHLKATVALGQDDIDFSLGPIYFFVNLKSVSSRIEYTKKIGKGMSANIGFDGMFGQYDVRLRLPPMPRPGEPPNQPFATRNLPDSQVQGTLVQPAGYVELELSPDPRLRIVPGLRFDYLNFTDQFETSPRINARFDINKPFPRTTLKGGIGVFHQPPQPQEIVPPFGNVHLKANRAIQYALGVEQDITRQVEASVEGFYKQLDNQVVSTAVTSDSVAYSNLGSGYVVGSEVLLKYKPDARFFGWLAYTLSRSVRRDGPGLPEHLLSFDQTHILTVLGSYRLGHGWEFGARFRLVSGNLITPYVCDATSTTCNPSRTSALFHGASGVYVPIPLSSAYSERLPLFHQLDLRLDKVWKFSRFQVSTYLDIQNVYNSQNVEGVTYNYNYTARQYVTGLPIIPSIGLRGEF